MRILLGIVFFVLGISMAKYSRKYVEMLGKWGWAERNFPGGSYGAVKIIGVLFAFAGMAHATNTLQPLLNAIFSIIFPGMG